MLLSPSERMTTRYEIQGRLGQGGSGAVYRALDTRLQRAVAIKKLAALTESNGSATSTHGGPETLRHEALLLSGLQHPNIVTVHDIEMDEEGPFVVMELIEGQTLDAVITQAPLPLKEFGILVRDCLSGLAAAHARGILHRDLKPGNIMLTWLPTQEMQFKLLDFGIAKLSSAPSLQTLDQSGGLLGSIHFMAPEQFERTPLDARTDLYSLGCVFFFALTGRYPFDGDTVPQVMAAHLHHQHGPLSEWRPDLPPAIIAWVLRLMSRQPDDRPVSSAAALTEFQEAAQPPKLKPLGPPTIIIQTPLVSAPPSTQGPKSGLWIATGLAACLGLGGYLFWKQQSPSSVPTVAATTTPAPTQAVIPEVTPAKTTLAHTPEDLTALRARLDQHTDVEGTVVSIGESKTGRTRYANFSRRPGETISLAFRMDGHHTVPQRSIEALRGQRVRARGKVTEFRGDLLLYVDRVEDLQQLP